MLTSLTCFAISLSAMLGLFIGFLLWFEEMSLRRTNATISAFGRFVHILASFPLRVLLERLLGHAPGTRRACCICAVVFATLVALLLSDSPLFTMLTGLLLVVWSWMATRN